MSVSRIVVGGDDLLAVKENQPRLFEDIKTLIRVALGPDFVGRDQTNEHGHSREAFRFCVVLTNQGTTRERGR